MRSVFTLLLVAVAAFGCERSPRRGEAPAQSTAEEPTQPLAERSSAMPLSTATSAADKGEPLKLAPLDPKSLSSVEAFIERQAKESRGKELQSTLLSALGELEARRLPPALLRLCAAHANANLSRSEVEQLIGGHFRANDDNLAQVSAACPAEDLGALLKILTEEQLGAVDKTEMAFSYCRLTKAGLVKPDEIAANWTAVVLAHVIRAYLLRGGPLHPVELRILRLLATNTGEPLPKASVDKIKRSEL